MADEAEAVLEKKKAAAGGNSAKDGRAGGKSGNSGDHRRHDKKKGEHWANISLYSRVLKGCFAGKGNETEVMFGSITAKGASKPATTIKPGAATTPEGNVKDIDSLSESDLEVTAEAAGLSRSHGRGAGKARAASPRPQDKVGGSDPCFVNSLDLKSIKGHDDADAGSGSIAPGTPPLTPTMPDDDVSDSGRSSAGFDHNDEDDEPDLELLDFLNTGDGASLAGPESGEEGEAVDVSKLTVCGSETERLLTAPSTK